MHQVGEPGGQPFRAVLAREAQQGLDDGPDAVVRDGVGLRAPAAVDEGVQGLVEVEVHALEPVGEFLVGEAVAGSGGHEQALGEDGRRPAGAAAEPRRGGPPREHLLEGLPVQVPRAGAEAAPGGLVHLPGDLGGQSAYGGAAQAVPGGQAAGDAQGHQVQVGGEDAVPVGGGGGRGVGGVGEGGPDLGEQTEGEGVPGVGGDEGALRDAVAQAGLTRLVLGEVAETHARGPVQEVRHLLPVLRPARHDQTHARLPQPPHRPVRPVGQAAGQGRRHLLGVVEDEQQGAAEGAGEAGEALGGDVARVGGKGGACGRHDGEGPGQ